MHVLEISKSEDLRKIMQDIGVDPYGIKIMVPKGITHLLRLNAVSNIAANILKQEMLSLGGDVALSRGALTGKSKKTDCLIMGNLAQIKRLNEKLQKQPFGLSSLALELRRVLDNYDNGGFILRLGKHKLNLGLRPHIMGIINLTPDSFSGDGLYQGLSPSQLKGDYLKGTVPELAEKMVKDGADIIDVGGESSRPGARPVALKEELKRTIPVIKILARKIKSPISIDTYKPEVAKQALDNGAVLVNDIRGLSNAEMRKVVARSNAGAVIMHMKGTPHTMQKNPVYRSVVCEVMGYLKQAIERAKDCGISEDKIIVDPGIGFGKTAEDNLELLKRLNEFKVLGRPILVGPSRKSFIGAVLKAAPPDRVYGTVSACVLAVKNGASIVRVHDCLEVKQAFKVMEAIDKA